MDDFERELTRMMRDGRRHAPLEPGQRARLYEGIRVRRRSRMLWRAGGSALAVAGLSIGLALLPDTGSRSLPADRPPLPATSPTPPPLSPPPTTAAPSTSLPPTGTPGTTAPGTGGTPAFPPSDTPDATPSATTAPSSPPAPTWPPSTPPSTEEAGGPPTTAGSG